MTETKARIQRLQGMSPSTEMAPAESDTVSANCKWYFGHEVQVITYFSRARSIWSVLVYQVDATIHTSPRDTAGNDIHLYASSPSMLSYAIEAMEWQLYDLMDQAFTMEEGARFPGIKKYPARCDCHQSPSFVVTDHANTVQALEARLQALEDKLGDRNTNLDSSAQAGSLQTTLQTIESTLTSIEQRLQDRPAETTAAPVQDVSPVDVDPVQSEEQLELPVFSLQDRVSWKGFGQLQLPSLDGSGRSTFVSDVATTAVTNSRPPTATGTRARTPTLGSEQASRPVTGPDEAAQLNRAIMRQEINKALAAAMVGMAGLLDTGNGGGT